LVKVRATRLTAKREATSYENKRTIIELIEVTWKKVEATVRIGVRWQRD